MSEVGFMVWYGPRKVFLGQALQKWTGRRMGIEVDVILEWWINLLGRSERWGVGSIRLEVAIMPCLLGLIHHMVDAKLLQNF